MDDGFGTVLAQQSHGGLYEFDGVRKDKTAVHNASGSAGTAVIATLPGS